MGATLWYPWRIEQGERERLVIPILDADSNTVDISGWVIDARIKSRPGGDTLYLWPADLSSNDGVSISLTIPAQVSALWTFSTGWWRAVVTDSAPDRPNDPSAQRVIAGPFVVDVD